MVVRFWNERIPPTDEPALTRDLPQVPREGDTVALPGMACGRVTRVDWNLVAGVVNVYAR